MQSLFNQYAAAFECQDAEAINVNYEFPMAFYSEQGQLLMMEKSAFEKNTQKLLEKYQQLGLAKVDFELLGQQNLSESLLLVAVLWKFKRVDDSEIYRATTRYVVNGATQKIVSVFVVDEARAWQRLNSTRTS